MCLLCKGAATGERYREVGHQSRIHGSGFISRLQMPLQGLAIHTSVVKGTSVQSSSLIDWVFGVGGT